MSDSNTDATGPRPYGLFGLVVSLAIILVGTVLLGAVVVAAIFAVAFVGLGHQQVMDRIAALDLTGGDPLSRAKVGFVGSLIGYGALALVVVVVARFRGGPDGWRALVGWRPWSGWRAKWMWGLAALMIGYSLVATTALTHYFPKFDAAIKLPDGRSWALLLLLLAAVVGPIGEEILFRGWIYTSLRASFGVAAALIVVSILFALAHWEATHLYALAVFPVGLGLAWIRERTDSIKTSIVVHALYNGVAAALLIAQR